MTLFPDPRLLALPSWAERYLRHPELLDIPFVIPPMVVAERVYRSFYLLWETFTEKEKSNYRLGGGEMITPGTYDAYDADEEGADRAPAHSHPSPLTASRSTVRRSGCS